VEAAASPIKTKSKGKEGRRRRRKAEQTKVDTKGKRKVRDSSVEDEEDGDNAVTEEMSDSDTEQDAAVAWKADAYVTGVNYHVKKMIFLLFINSASTVPSTIDHLSYSNRPSCGIASY
jgi:hypothetical protein